MKRLILATKSLAWREILRFVRQRSRVIGAFGTPIIFWLLIGSGVGRSFQAAGGYGSTHGYLHYFFAGTMLMIVLFSAIFSTISIIEDRKAGFLQGVLVSPAPTLALVLGKVLGGVFLATLQAMLFYLLALGLGWSVGFVQTAQVLFSVLVNAAVLTSLGYVMAWPMSSTQGFHALMNVVLFPMWLLSGALFPPEGATAWIRWIMYVNPLTYGLATLRHAVEGESPHLAWCEAVALKTGVSSLWITYLALIILMALLIDIALRQTRKTCRV